jgi:hypothetical protein
MIDEIMRSMRQAGKLTGNALPTKYSGIVFRSRLEARWAVFFDTLGIEWEYEPQGYKIGNGIDEGETIYVFSDGTTSDSEFEVEIKKSQGIELVSTRISEGEGFEWYLPDFWLPDLNIWAEVKGDANLGVFQTITKAVDLFSSCTLPNLIDYNNVPNDFPGVGGLMVLGNIPRSDRLNATGSHITFAPRKGAASYPSRFRVDHNINEVRLEMSSMSIDVYDVWSMSGDPDNDEHFSDSETYKFNFLDRGMPRDPVYSRDPVYFGYERTFLKHMSPTNSRNGSSFLPIEEDMTGEFAINTAFDRARDKKF